MSLPRILLPILAAICLGPFFPGPELVFAAEAASHGLDGELLFRVHCASCHGLEARGDGPMRDVLRVTPTDLTLLRESNDGQFPWEHTREIIDGRGEVRGHGSSEMPVWGMTFQDPGRAEDQEDEIGLRIESLLRYLESIQD